MLRSTLLLCACLLAAGFPAWPGPSASLAAHLVAPGGTSPLLPADRIEAALARLPDRSGRVVTGSGARVFWRAIDPGDYGVRTRWPAGRTHDAFPDIQFEVPAAPAPPPRGTVVLLHGWMMTGDSLLPWALRLGEAGYRTVSIDLRNHGRSDAAPVGYGTREARDVVEVVDALRARGEIVGPLHLLGVSYGAATAVFAAADPRLGAERVVALESFAVAGTAIRDMVPHMLQSAPAGWSERLARRWMQWRMDDAALDAAVAEAGAILDLPLDAVDVGAALARVPCPLLVHGGADRHVPVAHGRALAAAAPHARYLEIAGESHLSLPMRLDLLAPVVVDWFDRPACPGDVLAEHRLD
ncbi:alpha/beta hydrolase [Luteimonas sp. RD2P54]|uniref:Alpha/beta hydrolase n=1 Tax=Luteimonas endophytica TaxID=3042023 RepID=A0ABT6JBU0_9GAMM|nr:alpha/beta hydrolase [Luteimonas endophytica]MDH5823663.1 alpha/beta hydrolase [Luteimonas endophytica]